MSFISREVQVIFGALKQALESEPNPGNSVNSTDNPMQVGLIGRFNLHKAAERVWDMLKAHLEAERAALEKKIDEAIKADKAKVETEVKNV